MGEPRIATGMGIHSVSEIQLMEIASSTDKSIASFNGGARVCLGQQLALTQATYVVVRMMQEFKAITNRDKEEEWQELITLNTKSRHGTKVALMKADKKSSS